MDSFIKSLTKNDKEGFTDIPDIKITDKCHRALMSYDINQKSDKEIELLKEMCKAEVVFPPKERRSNWSLIMLFLHIRQINLNIFKRYEYKGFHLSIISYLAMKGANERDGALVECSRSIKLALDMWHANKNSNLDELYQLSQKSLHLGYKLAVSMHEEAIILSAEVNDGGEKGRENNAVKWQREAQDLADAIWVINPTLSLRKTSEKIKPTLDKLFEKKDISIPSPGRIRKIIKK